MGKIKWVLMGVLVLDIIFVNLGLYLLWNRKNPGTVVKNDNKCSTDCAQLIDRSLASLTLPSCNCPLPTPSVKEIKTKVSLTKNTQYLPIPGNGSTLENKWTDLAGTEFYLSTEDYPNLTGAYFEANMKLTNGNGFGYLRLFDVTAGIEVWGSEISTNKQIFSSVSSGKITLRQGTRLYRVQAKSLTADTTVFNSGRMKLISEY